MRRFTVWALVLLMLGCSDDPPVSPGEGTQLVSVRVQPNSTSELAVAVEVVVDQADSARVLFVERGGTVDSTPFVPLAQRQARIPVLGLRSEGRYRGVVELAGAEGTIQSDSVDFEGGDLPELLQRVSITTTGRGSPGWTLTALPIDERALVAFAFDSAGTIRWYREFADPGAGGELKQQANGNYTIYIGASFGSQPVPGRYVEFTPEGDSIRSFDAPEPLYTDNHELVITGSGASERAHLFGYDHRTTDLTFLGGPPDAQLAGHRVLRLRPDGSAEFSWSGWDHFKVEDWIEPPFPEPADPDEPDFDHPNSLTFDRDGNYIVSWRNQGQITKIDATSGEVHWRIGGVTGQFTFVDDPFGGFSAQHHAHILENGHLLLYDNGTRHDPPETRVVEYALDTSARTATLVWEFRHDPPIYTPFVGSVQRLKNGDTLIGYGTEGLVTEVAPDGSVVWEAELKLDDNPAVAYRLIRVPSLYRYESP